MAESVSVVATKVTRPWEGAADETGVESWVNAALERHKEALEQLLAVSGLRTVENTLSAYDSAVAELSMARSQTALLNSVHPEKKVRDAAQTLIQKVAEAGTLLALNQEVYRALEAMDLSGADSGTRHYVERTLLQYPLAGLPAQCAGERQQGRGRGQGRTGGAA